MKCIFNGHSFCIFVRFVLNSGRVLIHILRIFIVFKEAKFIYCVCCGRIKCKWRKL